MLAIYALLAVMLLIVPGHAGAPDFSGHLGLGILSRFRTTARGCWSRDKQEPFA